MRLKKYFLAGEQYTEGAGTNKTFAHGRLSRRVEAKKQSAKRSACSALSFSWSDRVSSDGDIGRLFAGLWEESEISFRDAHSSSSLTVPELDGRSGMVVDCVVGAEARVGWAGSWSKILVEAEVEVHKSYALSVPS